MTPLLVSSVVTCPDTADALPADAVLYTAIFVYPFAARTSFIQGIFNERLSQRAEIQIEIAF